MFGRLGVRITMHIKQPINLNSADFLRNEYAYYRWMRAQAPVSKARMWPINNVYVLACYDDALPNPDPRLAVDPSEVRYVERPLMHRLPRLPVTLA